MADQNGAPLPPIGAKGVVCAGCGEVHDTLYLHGRCHPDTSTWAILHLGETPRVEIICAECQAHIVTFDVVTRPG